MKRVPITLEIDDSLSPEEQRLRNLGWARAILAAEAAREPTEAEKATTTLLNRIHVQEWTQFDQDVAQAAYNACKRLGITSIPVPSAPGVEHDVETFWHALTHHDEDEE